MTKNNLITLQTKRKQSYTFFPIGILSFIPGLISTHLPLYCK